MSTLLLTPSSFTVVQYNPIYCTGAEAKNTYHYITIRVLGKLERPNCSVDEMWLETFKMHIIIKHEKQAH